MIPTQDTVERTSAWKYQSGADSRGSGRGGPVRPVCCPDCPRTVDSYQNGPDPSRPHPRLFFVFVSEPLTQCRAKRNDGRDKPRRSSRLLKHGTLASNRPQAIALWPGWPSWQPSLSPRRIPPPDRSGPVPAPSALGMNYYALLSF